MAGWSGGHRECPGRQYRGFMLVIGERGRGRRSLQNFTMGGVNPQARQGGDKVCWGRSASLRVPCYSPEELSAPYNNGAAGRKAMAACKPDNLYPKRDVSLTDYVNLDKSLNLWDMGSEGGQIVSK